MLGSQERTLYRRYSEQRSSAWHNSGRSCTSARHHDISAFRGKRFTNIWFRIGFRLSSWEIGGDSRKPYWIAGWKNKARTGSRKQAAVGGKHEDFFEHVAEKPAISEERWVIGDEQDSFPGLGCGCSPAVTFHSSPLFVLLAESTAGERKESFHLAGFTVKSQRASRRMTG